MSNFSGNQSVEADCEQFVLLSVIDVISIVIGQPLNVKMLWITFTSKKTVDILNLNLALFNNLQYFIYTLHLIYLLLASEVSQTIATFLLVFVQIGGPMSLSFISMERYVAVIHPTSYPLLKKYRIRELLALTVWLSLPAALLSVFITLDRSASDLDATLTILPSSVMCIMGAAMVVCSYKIAKALKKSSPGSDTLHPVKRRAFRVVCATSVVTMSCYLPVNAVQYMKYRIGTCAAIAICLLLLSVASFVHSVLYLSTHLKLFVHLKALCNAKH